MPLQAQQGSRAQGDMPLHAGGMVSAQQPAENLQGPAASRQNCMQLRLLTELNEENSNPG